MGISIFDLDSDLWGGRGLYPLSSYIYSPIGCDISRLVFISLPEVFLMSTILPVPKDATTSLDIQPTSLEKSLQILLQQGPLAVLAAGGATALWKGLLPTFELRQATFGAILLLLAALADIFVWLAKRRAAQQRYEARQKDYQGAADDVRNIDEDAPSTRGHRR